MTALWRGWAASGAKPATSKPNNARFSSAFRRRFETPLVGVGGGRSDGLIFSAQASDFRASSTRPCDISQCGDSGTQARTNKVNAAGITPIRNNPRQPIESVVKAANDDAIITPSGMNTVTRPPMNPRIRAGTNSCTKGRSTQYNPPTPKPTKNRNTDRNTQPLSGVNARTPLAMEKLRTVPMNTFRRP